MARTASLLLLFALVVCPQQGLAANPAMKAYFLSNSLAGSDPTLVFDNDYSLVFPDDTVDSFMQCLCSQSYTTCTVKYDGEDNNLFVTEVTPTGIIADAAILEQPSDPNTIIHAEYLCDAPDPTATPGEFSCTVELTSDVTVDDPVSYSSDECDIGCIMVAFPGTSSFYNSGMEDAYDVDGTQCIVPFVEDETVKADEPDAADDADADDDAKDEAGDDVEDDTDDAESVGELIKSRIAAYAMYNTLLGSDPTLVFDNDLSLVFPGDMIDSFLQCLCSQSYSTCTVQYAGEGNSLIVTDVTTTEADEGADILEQSSDPNVITQVTYACDAPDPSVIPGEFSCWAEETSAVTVETPVSYTSDVCDVGCIIMAFPDFTNLYNSGLTDAYVVDNAQCVVPYVEEDAEGANEDAGEDVEAADDTPDEEGDEDQDGSLLKRIMLSNFIYDSVIGSNPTIVFEDILSLTFTEETMDSFMQCLCSQSYTTCTVKYDGEAKYLFVSEVTSEIDTSVAILEQPRDPNTIIHAEYLCEVPDPTATPGEFSCTVQATSTVTVDDPVSYSSDECDIGCIMVAFPGTTNFYNTGYDDIYNVDGAQCVVPYVEEEPEETAVEDPLVRRMMANFIFNSMVGSNPTIIFDDILSLTFPDDTIESFMQCLCSQSYTTCTIQYDAEGKFLYVTDITQTAMDEDTAILAQSSDPNEIIHVEYYCDTPDPTMIPGEFSCRAEVTSAITVNSPVSYSSDQCDVGCVMMAFTVPATLYNSGYDDTYTVNGGSCIVPYADDEDDTAVADDGDDDDDTHGSDAGKNDDDDGGDDDGSLSLKPLDSDEDEEDEDFYNALIFGIAASLVLLLLLLLVLYVVCRCCCGGEDQSQTAVTVAPSTGKKLAALGYPIYADITDSKQKKPLELRVPIEEETVAKAAGNGQVNRGFDQSHYLSYLQGSNQ